MARRLWKQKLQSCSLTSLETHILGVKRVGDIPGYEIPGRYFEFLQTRDGTLLQDIVKHNVIDIVSMSTLLYRLQTTAELPPEECDCSYEAEAIAHLSFHSRKPRLALKYLEAAAQLSSDDEQYLRISRNAAAILKRLGQYERALPIWKRILEIAPDDLSTAEELAKYYEHRTKDLTSAEQITRRALAVAWQSRSPKTSALEHRLRRLERKTHARTAP
jgi:tetratricopeptide (TPR) repeat protein